MSRVLAWQRSGESADKFATRHGYNPRTLQWWATTGKRRMHAKTPVPAFVEVTSDLAHPASAAQVEVVLRGGRTLRISGGIAEAMLRTLITVLEE